MTEEEERNIISNLGIGQVFEGIGNIINIVGRVIDKDIVAQDKERRNEKKPVGPPN